MSFCYWPLLAVSFAALVVAAAALAWAEQLRELERELVGSECRIPHSGIARQPIQAEATAIAERAWA